jgi:hypothetical protein
VKHSVKRYGPLVAVLLLVLAAIVAWGLDDARDRVVWWKLRPILTSEHVTDIAAIIPRPVSVPAEEREQFLALLRTAMFDRSNREGHGPTPSHVLVLTFRDGRTLNVGFWGGERFELSPEHLDADSQFVIKSAELGQWVRTRFPIAP